MVGMGISVGGSSSLRNWNSMQSANFGGTQGLNFPSPFLDFESTKIPASIKEIFELLIHAYLTDSNINPAIENIASYPITTLALETDDDVEKDHKDKWEEILEEVLDVRNFNISVGFDYFLYGNAFVSVYEPFDRYLKCEECGLEHNTKYPATKWKWKNLRFIVKCTKCEDFYPATIVDKVSENANDINLIRWSPYHIRIESNPTSGKRFYWYDIPEWIKQKIIKGDPLYILDTPIEFIEAVVNTMRGKGHCSIKFKPEKIFAMQRPMPSMPGDASAGWGIPLATSSLRDYYYKNIMRRAQAMVLYEHIIPFRIFSPSYVENPTTMLPLATWQKEIMTNYLKWRKNPLHIMTAPIPLNVQQVGAQGKALALFPEIQLTDGNIIKGMNIPREFVEGGLQYSGSSVSLRMLENILLDYIHRSERMINWIMKKVGRIIKLSYLKASYVPFKMADDIQLKSLLDQMHTNGKISGEFLGNVFEFDSDKEQETLAKETIQKMIYQAKAQAEAQVELARITEFFAAQQMQAPSNVVNPIDPNQSAGMATELNSMPPQQQQPAMDQLNAANPIAAQGVNGMASIFNKATQQQILQLSMLTPEQQQAAIAKMPPAQYQLLKIVFPGPDKPSANANNGVRKTPMPENKPPRGKGTY